MLKSEEKIEVCWIIPLKELTLLKSKKWWVFCGVCLAGTGQMARLPVGGLG
jgi:hypothetical protein